MFSKIRLRLIGMDRPFPACLHATAGRQLISISSRVRTSVVKSSRYNY
jgi:hypothetical protein